MSIFDSKFVGLDISDHTIEIVEIEIKKKDVKLTSKNRVKLSGGIVEKGELKNPEELKKIIPDLLKKAKPEPIAENELVFGLPESQTYIHSFESTEKNKKKLEDIIYSEAIKNIPIENKNLTYFYKIIENKEKGEKENVQEIMIIAANQNTLKNWYNFFKDLEIEIKYFDLEVLALFRGLFKEKPSKNICLVDIGSETTNVSFFNKKGLSYEYTINIAGNDFTGAIINETGKEWEEAEKIKTSQGLNATDKRTKETLENKLDVIISELQESFEFFQKKYKTKIDEIILVGGTSQMKGLKKHLEKKIKIKITKGQSAFNNKIGIEYVEAIGLAIKESEKKWFKEEKTFNIKEILNKKAKKKIDSIKLEAKQELEKINLDKDSENLKNKNIKKQKTILTSIVSIGLVILSMLFVYMSFVKKDEAKPILTAPLFNYEKNFEFKIPVAVSPEEYAPNRLRARIMEDIVEEAEDFSKAIETSQNSLKEKINSDETIWSEPLNYNQENIEYPVTFRWLVYKEDEADNLFLKKFDEFNKNDVKYILNSINKQKLEKTDNNFVYYMIANINISGEKEITN